MLNWFDQIIWHQDYSLYTPKVGYRVRCDGDGMGEFVCWWKRIWKFKCLLKSQMFMWLALKNKKLTWDVLF